LAYGLSGWAEVGDDEKDWKASWELESSDIAQRFADMNLANLGKYAKNFAESLGRQIQRKIENARAEGKISSEEDAEIQGVDRFSKIHFAGYFKGAPVIATSTICFHLTESSASLDHPLIHCTPDESYFHGSPHVLALLSNTQEVEFGVLATAQARKHLRQQYRTPSFVKLIEKRGASLEEASEAARSYIQACSDSEAEKIDSERCSKIKGHIHVAKITPRGGFEWIVRPASEGTTTTPVVTDPAHQDTFG
jgi:hypothetical protein